MRDGDWCWTKIDYYSAFTSSIRQFFAALVCVYKHNQLCKMSGRISLCNFYSFSQIPKRSLRFLTIVTYETFHGWSLVIQHHCNIRRHLHCRVEHASLHGSIPRPFIHTGWVMLLNPNKYYSNEHLTGTLRYLLLLLRSFATRFVCQTTTILVATILLWCAKIVFLGLGFSSVL